MNTAQHLRLESIKTNPQLVRLLPPEVARRYHALPVATDGSRITVAMASPEDTAAAEAVSSAIGAPTCLVQADPQEIDQRLAEIWPQDPAPRLRLFVWIPAAETDPTLRPYAQAMADLLQADLKQVSFTWSGVKSLDAFVREAENFRPDLIIFQIPAPLRMKRLLVDMTVNKLLDRLAASLLVVKNPRWPLRKMLLVIRDSSGPNEAAVEWVIRLAHCSHAAVTVMPLLPPVPQMYGSYIHYSLPSLLTSNDPLGEKMRRIARHMTAEEVNASFKIRDGHPLEQLRYEVFDSDTDLVVIEAEPQHCLWQWLFGEVVNNLFAWFDRPLLITQR